MVGWICFCYCLPASSSACHPPIHPPYVIYVYWSSTCGSRLCCIIGRCTHITYPHVLENDCRGRLSQSFQQLKATVGATAPQIWSQTILCLYARWWELDAIGPPSSRWRLLRGHAGVRCAPMKTIARRVSSEGKLMQRHVHEIIFSLIRDGDNWLNDKTFWLIFSR